jgi:hypothetical protein
MITLQQIWYNIVFNIVILQGELLLMEKWKRECSQKAITLLRWIAFWLWSPVSFNWCTTPPFIPTGGTFPRTFNYLVVLHFYRGSCNNSLIYYPVMSFICLLLQLCMNFVAFSLFTLLALVLSYRRHPVITSFGWYVIRKASRDCFFWLICLPTTPEYLIVFYQI